MVTAKENLIGAYAFLAGVILAVAVGLSQSYFVGSGNSFPYLLLVVIGIVVGILNVGDKDSITFLLASLAIVVVVGQANNTLIFISNLSSILGSLNEVMKALLVLFVPATIIVALKTVFSIARV